jgi:hypothetical protein
MTERKVKRNQFSLIMKTFSVDCEKNEERMNDSEEQNALSSSRKTFIRHALRIFLIITTSNDTTYASQRPKNHASLLSHE